MNKRGTTIAAKYGCTNHSIEYLPVVNRLGLFREHAYACRLPFPLPSSLFPLPSSLFPLPSSLFPLPSSLFPLPSSRLLVVGNRKHRFRFSSNRRQDHGRPHV